MGFLSYSLMLYKEKIESFERDFPLDSDKIYEAKQYLKFLDDIIDEGYFYLPNRMTEDFNGYERLINVIKKNQEVPFPLNKYDVLNKLKYRNNMYELTEYIHRLINEMKVNEPNSALFLDVIYDYCEWLKTDYDSKSAYVFLLRDTLLPYISFITDERCKQVHAYPFLISRKWLKLITNTNDIDDDFRDIIMQALENGIHSYEGLINYCRPFFNELMVMHPSIKNGLDDLFSSIKESNIVVIETGVFATFPVMLACYDERVQIKLFTVTPFLYPIYKNMCFTQAYEINRDFETILCQDALFQLYDYHHGKFYIKEIYSTKIKNQAFSEINYIIQKHRIER